MLKYFGAAAFGVLTFPVIAPLVTSPLAALEADWLCGLHHCDQEVIVRVAEPGLGVQFSTFEENAQPACTLDAQQSKPAGETYGAQVPFAITTKGYKHVKLTVTAWTYSQNPNLPFPPAGQQNPVRLSYTPDTNQEKTDYCVTWVAFPDWIGLPQLRFFANLRVMDGRAKDPVATQATSVWQIVPHHLVLDGVPMDRTCANWSAATDCIPGVVATISTHDWFPLRLLADRLHWTISCPTPKGPCEPPDTAEVRQNNLLYTVRLKQHYVLGRYMPTEFVQIGELVRLFGWDCRWFVDAQTSLINTRVTNHKREHIARPCPNL